MAHSLRFLFTTFECGGHVPPPMRVARRLQDLGHTVLMVSDEANRLAAQAKNLPFTTWRRAPNRLTLGDAETDIDDWKSRWPPEVVRRVCASVMTGPAHAYASDTLEIAEAFAPDVIVSNELLLGVMVAAEARKTPLALLTANAWCYPTREDLPPFGPGFVKSDSRAALWRDDKTREMVRGFYDVGLDALNVARDAVGLAPVARTLDQLGAADAILLGVSRAFDYDAEPPPPFFYAGPLVEMPEWATAEAAPARTGRPRVLVSFGTTSQGQKPVIAHCIRALKRLPVEGIVTLGPAVTPEGLPQADNVTVLQAASHDEIVPTCAVVVCHGGHGTLLRPLMHGVPVLCLPMGRDHPENAARLIWRGAGLKRNARSSPATIAKAVRRLIADPGYRRAAANLGDRIRSESDGGERAADRLIAMAAGQKGLLHAA